jgi:hypothetical protein
VKDGKPRALDEKSVSVRSPPFPIKSLSRKPTWRKAGMDDMEKMVRKAVIDFIAKKSEGEALEFLRRTAKTFANQPSLWDQASMF